MIYYLLLNLRVLFYKHTQHFTEHVTNDKMNFKTMFCSVKGKSIEGMFRQGNELRKKADPTLMFFKILKASSANQGSMWSSEQHGVVERPQLWDQRDWDSASGVLGNRQQVTQLLSAPVASFD